MSDEQYEGMYVRTPAGRIGRVNQVARCSDAQIAVQVVFDKSVEWWPNWLLKLAA